MPGDIKPYLYDIELRTFIGDYDRVKYPNREFTYDGKVKISFKCTKPTKTIVLHSKNLNISTASLLLGKYAKWTGESSGIESLQKVDLDANIELDLVRDFIRISLKDKTQMLEEGAFYALSIDFVGVILEQPYGLYRSSYTEKSGRVK